MIILLSVGIEKIMNGFCNNSILFIYILIYNYLNEIFIINNMLII